MAFPSHLNFSADTENKKLAPQRDQDDCWTFCQVNKDFCTQDIWSRRKISFHQCLILHQRIVITDSLPSGIHACLCPFFTGAKAGSSFLPWWIALTSCLLSQWMCHYTTRSNRQNQKHCTVGWRYKWGEGWGSTDTPLKRGHNSPRWMVGNLSKWWDKIHFGDVWNASQSSIICTYVSTTECPPFPLFHLFFPPLEIQ